MRRPAGTRRGVACGFAIRRAADCEAASDARHRTAEPAVTAVPHPACVTCIRPGC